MFVGHYSAAFAVKAVHKDAPLWVLFGAAQLVDIFWASFILTGVERVRIVPGFTAANPLDLYYMPYTHSLPAAVLWSLAAALLYVVIKRPQHRLAAGVAIAVTVASHWVLDWLVHVPDLPLWGNQFKVGLGLWNRLYIAIALELALLALGLWLYMRSTRARSRAGRFAMPVFTLAMCVVWIDSLFAPPPSSVMVLGVSALAAYVLFAAIAGWLARFRV
ncbi:MAG: hypothetical protein ACRCV9_10110 [Burkholderiaceae bacterium]